MFGDLDKYLLVLLTGLLVSYLLTPVVRAAACRFGMVDLPNERRPHKRPTARGGGLAVVIGVHAACLAALAFPWPTLAGGLDLHWWRHYLVGSLILLVVGLLDDYRGLPPLVKLAGQTLAAIQAAYAGTRFGSVLGYQLPPWLDGFMVVFWILALINAFNLIDGLDGLATGLAIISAIGLCGIFFLNGLPGNALVLMGLIGACLGFLRYNFHPATIFLGDTGSMFLGFTLGVISMETVTKGTVLLALTIPTLVLGVPLYDEVLAVWRRSVRNWLSRDTPGGGGRRGVMQPDLDHLHHRLLKAGLSTRRVTTFLYIFNALLVGVGLLIALAQSHATGIFLLALLAAVYFVLRHLAVTELRDTGRVILAGLHRPTHATFKALLHPVWDLFCLSLTVAIAMALFDPPSSRFWHDWFLELPVWVTPTLSLLAVSRAYVTVWPRARTLDFLMLGSMLCGGLLVSLGLALIVEPSSAGRWLLRALVIGALSHPAILLFRAVYRFTEELVVYLRGRSEVNPQKGRVALYGAGGRCQLFLRERAFTNSGSFDGRLIVGLIDDEPTLKAQWVYGYPVLGGLADLPQILTRHQVNAIIITTRLRPEAFEGLKTLCGERGLELSQWSFGTEAVGVEKPEGPNLKPET